MKTIAEIVRRVQSGDKSCLDEFSAEERKLIEAVMRELRQEGRSKILESLWETDYEQRPASIDEFVQNEYYLGKIGVDLFPLWRQELHKIHDPKNEIGEVILRGSIGGGKTTVAVITLLYKIHQLICMKNPQKFYKLMEGSPIVFGLFNIFKYLALDTSYKYVVNWVKLSPFFRDAMKKAFKQDSDTPDWLRKLNKLYGLTNDDLAHSYVRFPKDITIALGSQAIHALGQNLFGGLLDEADLGKHKSMSDAEKGQIADLYGQARSRMDSRFMQIGGANPGMLILVSQVRDKDSFLEQHISKVRNDARTHIASYPLWEIKGHLFPPEEPRFKVCVGNQRVRSFILDEKRQPAEGCRVIEVPESLRPRFVYDLDGAIRDLAGIPTYGHDLFLPRRDKLFECYEKSTAREHPFTIDTVELSIEADDTTSIIDCFVKDLCMFQHDKVTGSWKPRFYAGSRRAVHIDLSLTKDNAGIAMGTIGDVRVVERFDKNGRPYRDQDYTIFIDFALSISAKRGSEIDFSKIRAFVFYLADIGFPIEWISLDGFQSADTIQQFKKAGFDAKLLSVDKTAIPYNYLRSAIMETRLDIYDHSTFTNEVTKLEDHSLDKRAKPPIDHPKNGSKDVCDSVCGVTTRLIEEVALLLPTPSDKSIDDRAAAMQEKHKDPREMDEEWVAEQPVHINSLEDFFKDT